MDKVLWLEPLDDGTYVSDASRALDTGNHEPCRMALIGRGYDLAVTRDGMTLARLELDGESVIRSIAAAYGAPGMTEGRAKALQGFIGCKVLYRHKKEG